MPLRRGRPYTFKPLGASDSVDGTNTPRGSMAALTNLVPDPSTAGLFVPRPASELQFFFDEFVSALLTVGDRLYGMKRSLTFPGFDEPFAYDLTTGTPLEIHGVTASNIPVNVAATGEWEPPIMAAVGSSIVVCHFGFNNASSPLFGWLDISGFSQEATGNVHTGTRLIDGNPRLVGVQPGMTISGPGVPADSFVLSTAVYVNDCIGDITSGTNTILNVSVTSGIAVGQVITGVGIVDGTIVDSIVGDTVTMNNNATATDTDHAITFTGGTILMSEQGTADNDNAVLQIEGGTRTIPLWGAGDTDRNGLAQRPVAVAQFNGRAYYALAPDHLTGAPLGIQFSDSGLPRRISNTLGVQALTPANGLPVTALGPLMLSAPLVTTGIVASLLAFQGAAAIQQITGDPDTEDLRMNALPIQTGTLSPLSIATCEKGTVFVSPDGLRLISFDAKVSDPIGMGGGGICLPFINTAEPSRIVAACNRSLIRVSNDNGGIEGNPRQEWWYDTSRRVWTGPHTFPANLIQPWSSQKSFVLTTYTPDLGPTTPAALWKSDPVPLPSSLYVENGADMTWLYQPSPLPDNGDISMNAVVYMTIAAQFHAEDGHQITINASDMNGYGLGQAVIPFTDVSPSLWDEFNFGQGHWGDTVPLFQQWACNFEQPLEFKQLNLQVRGLSAPDTRIGNVYMRIQLLGYRLEAA